MLPNNEGNHLDAGVVGLIMAGGQSQRMRSTSGPMHKGLVPILGVPLLERNICALVAKGIRRIIVATNERENDIRNYVHNRAQRIVDSVGGAVECFDETSALGTIGAAGQVGDLTLGQIVVANVDNLTTLDWKKMLSYHRCRRAAMTVAAHRQAVQSSLGELTVEDGNVTQYQEKPVRRFLISSGSYVLDAATCRLIPTGQRTDAPDLVKLLLEDQKLVAAFQHESPWIDVNTAECVADAERLVAHHFREFECWHPAPKAERLHLLVCSGSNVLGHRVLSEGTAAWHLPEASVECDANESAAKICHDLGIGASRPCLLGAYDDLDEHGGSATRRHIFLLEISARTLISVPDGYAWIRLDQHRDLSGPMSRAANLLKTLG